MNKDETLAAVAKLVEETTEAIDPIKIAENRSQNALVHGPWRQTDERRMVCG
jgi:hypothetical protein